ncbi:MAG: flagellar basal-body rod protein FlgG [Hyphomicrobiales bacterium]|nr:flagellar basal-body rod protein FlgG [Hyphomicrobiales bacterium]
MRALAIAASGMNAQQLNVEVISHNIANINTTSFKRDRAEFTDLLYQIERAAGAPARGGSATVPEGARIGLGVRVAAVRSLHEQGALAATSNNLDLAISGNGWFQIAGPNNENLYTRGGAFNINADRQLVTVDGYLVQPTITFPDDTLDIVINESGEVFASIAGQIELQNLGQLSLTAFANPTGLDYLGNNLFRETDASGAAETSVPGTPGLGTLRQGYLESSNVDPVREITELISAQRAYEMNSKVIQAADSMLDTVANRLR